MRWISIVDYTEIELFMLTVIAISLLILSAGSMWLTGATFKQRHMVRSAFSCLCGLLFLTASALAATIQIATHGYRALTREEPVARIAVEPLMQNRFRARVTYPDGADTSFVLSGNQVYVDAHILKWKPWVNLLGLHTAYELDRIGGRYRQLTFEQDSLRTVFSLKREKPVDMFDLRTRYSMLSPLLDAEYGSGTFVAADQPARFEVLLSTSGLLIRHLENPAPEG